MVFDIGGVLLDWDPRHLYRQVFDDEQAMEQFLGRICTPQWHEQHDRGASTASSCARLAEAHPEHADEIWAWMTRGEEMVAGTIEDSVEILAELHRGGVACYALSNMEAETFPVRRRRFAFFDLFDGIVISGVEGVAKPDPVIFELLLRRYGLDAGATLFIDDNAENLAPASALGMSTVLFQSPEGLRRSLRHMDLLPAGR
ncbi:MAG TPA: HAD family phosphatase [Acidimicrobiales bacterium]